MGEVDILVCDQEVDMGLTMVPCSPFVVAIIAETLVSLERDFLRG